MFGDVLVHLIQKIETRALVELSRSLAPVNNAPIEVIRRLSRHDKITIAGPVLTQSDRLTEIDLIEVAKSKGQGHLLAISGRFSLPETVTDLLVERGDVCASDLVRTRLLAVASPEKQKQIQGALRSIAAELGQEATQPCDFARADSLAYELNRCGQLTEAALVDFVKARKHEEMTATLALFSGVKSAQIERLLKNMSHEGLIVACRAGNLTWPTVALILKSRFAFHPISQQELSEARDAFLELSRAAAQKSMRSM